MILNIAALSVSEVLLAATPALIHPLSSWNDTDAKNAIINFFQSLINPVSTHYVTPAKRIAIASPVSRSFQVSAPQFPIVTTEERSRMKQLRALLENKTAGLSL